MNIFKQIKESVTARQAAELYGLKVNRNGMTCCPFHNDKHPSMKVDKSFYCFACGEKGDVIHFTEKFFGLSVYEAAKKLAEDFHIPIENSKRKSKSKYRKKETKKKTKYQLMQEFEKWEIYCIRTLSEYLHLLEVWKLQYAPQQLEDGWREEFIEACNRKTIIEYYLDILLDGELEERIRFVKNKGEEVRKIERRLEQYRRKDNERNGISSLCDGRKLVS